MDDQSFLLEATRPLLVLDYFRVPYRVVDRRSGGDGAELAPGCERIWRAGDPTGRALVWPAAAEAATLPAAPARIGSISLHVGAVPDARAAGLLGPDGGWAPATPLVLEDGGAESSIWRSEGGSVFLPFDPDEAIRSFWSERYRDAARRSLLGRLRGLAVRVYYRVRPLLPRRLQIALRRRLTRIQARTRFPRWPVETSLHDLYALLLDELARVAGEPLPWIEPWPGGYAWAIVLTHDVETSVGCESLSLLRDVELATGFRSSWNFVPRRYEVADAVVRELTKAGFEVGVHGLYHDGRDLESLEILNERLPAIRGYAERWQAVGFRSPATHRVWEWMPMLGFEYDSSSPDTDPFEPQPGGCCSWLPFHNGELVELPLTLPQDHTLFVILRHADEGAWIEKTAFLRERGGMALLNTHPDYMLDPGMVALYERFLRRFRDDETAWKPLPRELAAWWRRRAASRLERAEGEWRIAGPAEGEGTVAHWPQPG
ncbi:MAG: hypothetical protein ACXVZ1_12335 [Gaiellaceae bacterium]